MLKATGKARYRTFVCATGNQGGGAGGGFISMLKGKLDY